MSMGTISPDGKWMWTGTEWIPAPPTSPPVMPPSPPSNSAVPVSSGIVDFNFEMEIRRNIQMIGRECFPDDENPTWNILSIREENGLHWVETQPIPHVGYEKIMFAMDSPNIDGVKECHYWENGNWSILFT